MPENPPPKTATLNDFFGDTEELKESLNISRELIDTITTIVGSSAKSQEEFARMPRMAVALGSLKTLRELIKDKDEKKKGL